MKYVALLSGGKDSCFNIMKCAHYGHELICLANLCPPADFTGEDMDSFMYQTAGYRVLDAFSECLGVPLVRGEIRGQAVSQHLNYATTADDEVEDLFALLRSVMERFPDVQGVSCGAILSNYQRFRVENVCSRLGLVPLHFLWQRNRESLLDEMIGNRLHAVLIKVAGGGLDPVKHLGKDLGTLRPAFERLKERFGLDICGEGGEYESLVLDCPLFSKRIELTETEIVTDSEDPSVGFLSIKEVKTVTKDMDGPGGFVGGPASTPFKADGASDVGSGAITEPSTHCALSSSPQLTVGTDGLGFSNLLLPPPSIPVPPEDSIASICQTQLRGLFSSLEVMVQAVGAAMCDICYVHLYVGDMAMFSQVNDEYIKWFGFNPPSRSCVAIRLPRGVYVALDVMVMVGSHAPIGLGKSARREVLHVQSISEWAPMSIGPYSQATKLGSAVVFCAGQIALHPEHMTLLDCHSLLPDKGMGLDIVRILSSHDCTTLNTVVPRFCAPVVSRLVAPRADISTAELLNDIPLLLVCELSLCLRNAHEVVASLNADLRSRSVLCVVYVSRAEAPHGGRDKSKTLTDIKNITKWMILNQADIIWEKIEKVLKPIVHSTGEVDASDVDCDWHDEDTDGGDMDMVDPAVIVVQVDNLPRGAAVEVEVTSVSEQFQHCPYRSFTSERIWSNAESVMISTGVEDLDQSTPCWPLMMAAQGDAAKDRYMEWLQENEGIVTISCSHDTTSRFQSVPIDELISESLTGDEFPLKCIEQCAVSEACMCIGAVSVDLGCVPELSDLSFMQRRLLRASANILFSINKLLWQNALDHKSLRQIKFFVPVSFLAEDGLEVNVIDGINSYCQQVFGNKVSLMIIPTTDFSLGRVQATFVALNFLQVKTEMWIRGD